MPKHASLGYCVALLALASCSKSSDADRITAGDQERSAEEIAKSQKAIEDNVDCSKNDLSNMDMIVCDSIDLREAEAELERYLKASRQELVESIKFEKEVDPNSEADKALADFDNAHRDWKQFVKNKCRSETAYFTGSDMPRQNLRCYMTETKYRTLMLWQHWLTYRDKTPPKIARPKFDFGYVDWDGINQTHEPKLR
jgi:uncharacterized protein YecT (DUF1311 family)